MLAVCALTDEEIGGRGKVCGEFCRVVLEFQWRRKMMCRTMSVKVAVVRSFQKWFAIQA